MSAVLVTGAAGFIGSHVAEALVARGARVVGLDNFDPFYAREIKERNLAALAGRDEFELVEGDVRDEELVARLFAGRKIDLVVHLAAKAGVRPSVKAPALYADVNVRGTAVIFEAAARAGTKRIVYASSSSVYGAGAAAPFAEDAPVDRPLSPYAATKRANELQAAAHHHIHGGDVVGLRFFTVYGPRQRPEMAIHKFARSIDEGRTLTVFGDGTARRDFTYVDDIVDGVVGAVERGRGAAVYNLGESATTSVSALIDMLAERLCKPARVEHLPPEPGDVPLTCAAIERARRDLGYDPRVPLAAGLDRFVAWRRGVAARN